MRPAAAMLLCCRNSLRVGDNAFLRRNNRSYSRETGMEGNFPPCLLGTTNRSIQLSDRLSVVGVQNQKSVSANLVEVEHLADRVSDGIKGSAADSLTTEPVVFDETDDRSLVGDGVVNKVFQGPRRNHDEGLARAVTAATEGVRIVGVDTGQSVGRAAASAWSGQGISRTGGP